MEVEMNERLKTMMPPRQHKTARGDDHDENVKKISKFKHDKWVKTHCINTRTIRDDIITFRAFCGGGAILQVWSVFPLATPCVANYILVGPIPHQIEIAKCPSFHSDGFVYRPAVPSDLNALCAIEHGSFDYPMDAESFGLGSIHIALGHKHKEDGVDTYVLEYSQCVVAYVSVRHTPATFTTYIHSLAVIGAVCRRGVGRELLWLKITLPVDVENAVVGIQLHKSFGFVQKQRCKKHYGAMGNDGIKMDLFI